VPLTKVLPIAILSWPLFGAMGSLSLILALRCIARGEFLTAVVTLGASAFCFGLIIPFLKIVPGKVTPRVEFDDAGTTIRPDRGIDIPFWCRYSASS